LRPKDKKKRVKRKLILSGIVVFFLFSLYLFFSKLTTPPLEGELQPEPQSQLHVIEGSIKEKGSLYESLVKKKIPMRWIDLIISKLRPHVDFNKIKGGTYRFITDIGGELVKCLFEKTDEGWSIQKSSERSLSCWLSYRPRGFRGFSEKEG
jgi:hypothetical protein